MSKGLRYLLQAVNFSFFMLLVWYLSSALPYRQLEEGMAMVVLAFGHAGQPVEECHQRTPEELAKLPPNMRAPMECARERSPVIVDLLIDDEPVLNITANPPGLFKDQGVDIYRRIEVPAGTHRLAVRMGDSVRTEGFAFEGAQEVDLAPAQLLFIDFSAQKGGFTFR